MAKRAIVLGGGGSRGPYHIGVWKALRELGIDYSIVTGSSVGAINGALMVQGDLETAKELWESLSFSDVVDLGTEPVDGQPDLATILRTAVEAGGLDVSPLEKRVRAVVDERLVRESPIDFGLVTARFPLMRPVQLLKEEIPEGEFCDYLLASSAWFPFFRRRTIDGKDYVDGAYADNLPAELAVRCGAQEIVAIDLQGAGIVHTFRREIPVRHIRCHWSLGDMLIFSPEQARRSFQLGYQDGLRAYRRVEGVAYAFAPGETRKNAERMLAPLDAIRRRTGVHLLHLKDKLPRIQQSLRYRNIDHRFLYGRDTPPAPTIGGAITTAGEIAGELLKLPPNRIYRMDEFNRLLFWGAKKLGGLPGAQNLSETDDALFRDETLPDPQATVRARVLLYRLLHLLRDGYITGRLSDTFGRLAGVSPVESAAANYLFALELLHLRTNRETNINTNSANKL